MIHTTEKTDKKEKRTYVKPSIERIQMDSEISMVMMSSPPGDPVTMKKAIKQMIGMA